MQVRKTASSAASEAASSGGKKKSILKKSESGRGHLSSRGHGGQGHANDPERETLLISDESSNATPVAPRRHPAQLPKQPSLTAADLPPTANHDQLKALTGPKLRTGASSGGIQPLSNNLAGVGNGNGTVASKDIQTSTGNLPTNNNISDLASTTQSSVAQTSAVNAAGRKFERGREHSEAAKYKCPNDMCRHNKPSTSTASAAAKRKICLCGRTMVNQVKPTAATKQPPTSSEAKTTQLNEETKLLTSTASKERIPSSS